MIVGTIRTMDNAEECALSCFNLSEVTEYLCTKDCVVYDYYQLKDTTATNVMLLRFMEFVILLGIRCIVLCFTHMKRSKYYSFNVNDDTSTGGTSMVATGTSEESDPLIP